MGSSIDLHQAKGGSRKLPKNPKTRAWPDHTTGWLWSSPRAHARLCNRPVPDPIWREISTQSCVPFLLEFV